jgi:uncharacterized membrane protein
MMSSETSLKEPLLQIPKWLVAAFLIFSFLGGLDASYLTAKHYLGEAPSCGIFNNSCESVIVSEYAEIFGIPVALLGALYYFFIFFLIIAHLDTKRNKLLYLAGYSTILGFLASIWFSYLQIFVIKAVCEYCVFSALTSTFLFISALWLIKHRREIQKK